MLYFATYFDFNYLNRGLALFNSLTKCCSTPFQLFVLALDDKTADYFNKREKRNVTTIKIQSLENYFPELNSLKNNRSRVEYYFTLSPYLPLYILNVYEHVNQITTLDSDICFFSDPSVIFKTYSNASVLITPHHFTEKLKHLEKYGLYNVSFQSFKNDNYAKACLEDWRIKCAMWCFDYFDEKNNRFADQKYLDEWIHAFKNVYTIDLPEAGLAPWNIERYNLTIEEGKIYVNNKPLIFFHFHGLRILSKYFALSNLSMYKAKINSITKVIYHTYLKQITSVSKKNTNDIKINRLINLQRKSIFKLLFEANDFLYFNSIFIWSLTWRPLYLKYLSLSNKFNGRVNRFKNIYR